MSVTVRAYKLGALAQDGLDGIITIACRPGASAHYMTFETTSGTDYQVSAGSAFYITKFDMTSTGAAPDVAIGYGDNGVADGASAPTN